MKAIIPVAGAGTNLRPLTYTQPKALIPIAGKSILSVIVDQLLQAGITEFVFVVGYLGDKITDYIKKTYPDLDYHIVNQQERKGTAHAIWLTNAVVPDEEVLIVFGDTIANYEVRAILNKPSSQVGVKKVDDPRAFGVAELDEHDRILHFVEKPIIPKSNMALVGVYFIKEAPVMYQVLEEVLAGDAQEGEYHLTDALEQMLAKGCVFEAFRVTNWYDCGRKENVLATNATLLKQLGGEEVGQPYFHGTSVIIPPVSIAEGCKLNMAIIGPNVTIGEHTEVHASIIRDSIIGSFAKLEDILLESSIIGSDAYIRGNSKSMNIGDNTEIDLGAPSQNHPF